jgi:hypothetical protein
MATSNPKHIEDVFIGFTKWIGSVQSVVLHTLFFIVAMSLPFFGVDFQKVLLVVTTLVSFEAIYLSIFIQMSVNRTTEVIKGVEEDIEEISEDIEEIQEDIDEIQEDVDEIQEDVEDLSEEEVKVQA